MCRNRLSLGVLAASGLVLGACGTATLGAADVAKSTEDSLQQQVGTRPDVSCPHDLDAKVGASERCTLTAPGGGGTYGVTVTVDSVNGTDAHFKIKVDDKPQS